MVWFITVLEGDSKSKSTERNSWTLDVMTIIFTLEVAKAAVVRPYQLSSNRLVPCVQYSSINSIISYICFFLQDKLLMIPSMIYLTLHDYVMIWMNLDIVFVILLFHEYLYLSLQPDSLFRFVLLLSSGVFFSSCSKRCAWLH